MSTALGAGIEATNSLLSTFLNKKWRDQEREHAENRQDTMIADERAYAEKIRNEEWQREDELLAAQRAREDTSYQRTVEDARAAGLSPLAVSQLNAAGVPVNQSSGISSAGAAASTVNPSSYMANAPQMDISGIAAAYFSQQNIDEISRHNKATEAQAAKELDFQARKTNEELLQQSNQFKQRLDFDKSQAEAQTNQFMLTYQQNASQFTARLAQDRQFHLDDLKGKALDRALEDMHSVNKQNYDSAVDFAKSLNMPYVVKYYTSDEKYNNAMSDLKNIMIKGNRQVTNDIEANPDKYLSTDSASHSESENNGVSAGAGGNKASSNSMSTLDKDNTFGKTVVDKVSDTLSRGLNVSASAQKGSSQSDSYSLSKSDRAIQQDIQKLYGSVLEIPVRVYDWDDYEKHADRYK